MASRLAVHAEPALGKAAISQIVAQMIADALQPIWLSQPDAARKPATRLRGVLRGAGVDDDMVGEATRLPRDKPQA